MERIQYLLYRILGNDLPPRHRKNQVLNNLRFILDYETALEGVGKRWVVNRIVDSAYEGKITRLLEERGQEYSVIKFNRGEFMAVPEKDFRARTECLTGLNPARNRVLREGRREAVWVLPFDGNCFFTKGGWAGLARAVAGNPDARCAIVPMLRVFDEGLFLKMISDLPGLEKDEGLLKKAGVQTEPQVMLRHDSEDEFDENFSYGWLSKVDLLWRLGVPGIWDTWDWDSEIRRAALGKKSKDFEKYITAGYVWRLSSGNQKAETDIEKRHEDRYWGLVYLSSLVGYGPVIGRLRCVWYGLKRYGQRYRRGLIQSAAIMREKFFPKASKPS